MITSSTKTGSGREIDQRDVRSSEPDVESRPGTLARRSQWDPFHRMREDLDRLFDQYFGGWPVWERATTREPTWGLDVRETDDAVVVEADAPGFEPDDFDLQIRDNYLVLSAARKRESGERDTGLRSWRRDEFYRQFPLSTTVDPDRVEATYRNGVLTVSLPRSEKARTKRIPVRS